MSAFSAPKYSKPEIERRWLIAPDAPVALLGMESRLIEDWYVEGARLRLRRESIGDEPPSIWKLCKKYGERANLSQLMVNIYLDADEYEVVRRLPGHRLVKRRYGRSIGDPFKIDVFEGALAGFRSCECELEDWSAVAGFEPPAWVGPEVTHEPTFSGGSLARITPGDLGVLLERVFGVGAP